MIEPIDPDETAGNRQVSDIEELSRLFLEVAEVPREQQDALLKKLCSDHYMRRQVKELLAADLSEDQLLDHSLVPKLVNVGVGEYIAEYKLLKELGQGGMGVVFMAEQFEPVRRKVALKVIKPGVDTREVIARFDAERHALSLMAHPNIATVLDAGSTDTGRPYFVMELVDGEAITTYCDKNQLSVKQRLELFLPVCHAIQHAHQKGIIHRDIKPSNVLVAEYDGRPVAKVIDFGVAKAINQPLTDLTVATGFGQIIGTFEYMSPEQSRVNQLDVDTRSDIYSLGVLLYELITGSPPFDKGRLRSVAWDEMLRIIREEDPPRPSSRLAAPTTLAAGDDRPDPSGERDSNESAKLGRMLRGELDWIVLKAMEKDRNRRYETPNALANDIECFLVGDAVAACPPSAMYLFRKFAKRNKAAIATSVFVAAALILGMIGTSWQAIRATRAERVAELNAEKVQVVNDFLVDDLLGLAGAESQMSAGLRPDPNLKLETLLNRALDRVENRFDELPEIGATMKDNLADSFNSIGRYGAATALYENVLEYLRTENGDRDPVTIHVMSKLVRAYIDQSRLVNARILCDEALEICPLVFEEDHEVTLGLRSNLAIVYQREKKYKKAEEIHDDVLKIKRHKLGDGHPDTLNTLSNLATLYESLDRFGEAVEKHQRVLEVHRLTHPTDPLRVATSLNNLGRCYLKRGRRFNDPSQFDTAISFLEEGEQIYRRDRGLDHPETLEIQTSLAHAYCESHRYADAERILPSLFERSSRLRGSDHASTLELLNLLGWTYMRQDRLAESENILADALDGYRHRPTRSREMLQVMGNLAIVYHRMGKLEDAIVLDEETLDVANEFLDDHHVERLSCMVRLGLSYFDTNRVSAGRDFLGKAFDAGPNLPGAFSIAGKLAHSYLRENDIERARRWNRRQVISARDNLSGDSLQLAKVLAGCGSRLLKMKDWQEAEAVLRQSLSIRKSQSTDSWLTWNAQSMVGEALRRQKKYAQAKPMLTEAYLKLKELNDMPGEMPAEFDTRLPKALVRLIACCRANGETQEASKWSKEKDAPHAASKSK